MKTNSSKLFQNISDHLLIPVLIITNTTDNKNLNIIQNAKDQFINIYAHILYFKIKESYIHHISFGQHNYLVCDLFDHSEQVLRLSRLKSPLAATKSYNGC